MSTAIPQATVPIRFSAPVATVLVILLVFASEPHATGISVESALAGSTLFVALFPLLRRLGPSLNVLEPIIGAALTLGVLFGIKPLVMINDRDITYAGIPVTGGFREAVLLGFIGTASFVCAYELVSRRTNRPTVVSRATASVRLSLVLGGAMTLLGLALFTAHLGHDGSIWEGLKLVAAGASPELRIWSAGSSEYLSSAPILGACAAIVVVAAVGDRPMGRLPLLLATCYSLSAAGIFLLFGARRFVIPALLIPIVVAYLTRVRAPRARTLLLVLPIAFLVATTIPYARTAAAREDAGGAVPIYVESFLRPHESVSRFIRGNDVEMVPALAAQVDVLRKGEDFDFGRATLGDLALAPIPSALFPSKPTTARDSILIRVFGGPCIARRGGDTNRCADFSVIGTFHQDFWIPGVLVGMALLGLGSAALWRLYCRDTSKSTAVVAVASWVVFLPIIIRAGMLPGFAWWLYFALPSVIALRLIAITQGWSRTQEGEADDDGTR